MVSKFSAIIGLTWVSLQLYSEKFRADGIKSWVHSAEKFRAIIGLTFLKVGFNHSEKFSCILRAIIGLMFLKVGFNQLYSGNSGP